MKLETVTQVLRLIDLVLSDMLDLFILILCIFFLLCLIIVCLIVTFSNDVLPDQKRTTEEYGAETEEIDEEIDKEFEEEFDVNVELVILMIQDFDTSLIYDTYILEIPPRCYRRRFRDLFQCLFRPSPRAKSSGSIGITYSTSCTSPLSFGS